MIRPFAITYLAFLAISTVAALSFIEPSPYSIITKNTVRLRVETADSSIKQIRYYLTYKPSIDSYKQLTSGTITKELGSSNAPIFDFVADLSAIPDQDERTISFRAEGYDAGNKLIATTSDKQFLVLDRKNTVSSKIFRSVYKKTSPAIRNLLSFDYWKESDSIKFTNGENIITTRSYWNYEALSFLIEVRDNTIIGEYSAKGYLENNLDPVIYPLHHDYVPLPENDELEIFFDLANEHVMRRNLNQSHLLIGAKGAWYGRRYDRETGTSLMWGKETDIAVQIPEDSSYYRIAIQIPWRELTYEPVDNGRIGFDIYNKDYIRPNSPATGISWAGNEWTNYNNPSEWGDLLLVPEKKSSRKILLFSLPLIPLLLIVLVLFRKRIVKPPDSTLPSKSGKWADKTDELISVHYGDPDFNAQKAASLMGLNPKYLGATYKLVRNKTFLQQLTQFRIEKAVELIKKNEMTITEIAFKVGFSSSSHFAKVFKDVMEISPTDLKKG